MDIFVVEIVRNGFSSITLGLGGEGGEGGGGGGGAVKNGLSSPPTLRAFGAVPGDFSRSFFSSRYKVQSPVYDHSSFK